MIERPRNEQSLPERQARVHDVIESRNEDLADLVTLVAAHHPDSAEGMGRRARLDAYLALMAAETADRNARAAHRLSRSLTAATWALVLATVVLAFVSAFA